jgi:hypothetical protein
MHSRTILAAAAASIALVGLGSTTAQAASLERVDRSAFDATPQRSTESLHLDGDTAGPLGGRLDLTISSPDGSLPTAPGTCEQVDVSATLTVSPGEVLTVHTTGEACAHVISGALQVNAFFDAKDVVYSGTEHKKAKLVGDGLIAAADGFLGAQASFSAAVRW